MAQKPDGKPAGTQRVTFTKPAAERIARVVREIEGGDRDGGPLTFGARVGGDGRVFDSIKLKIHSSWPTLSHTPLAVGQGISIPLNRGISTRLAPNIDQDKLSGNRSSYSVSNENDLTAFGSGTPELYIESNDTDISLGSRCGVIASVSEEAIDGYWECTVRVRGLVRCRVLLLQAGASVSPPPPYPVAQGLQAFWRRYLMATEYGYGAIIGIGARFSLNGNNAYPAIAEAVVNLG